MKFIPTEISDIVIIEPKVFQDERGYFYESYKKQLFVDNGIAAEFVQDNVSRSVGGTLRGLHYQLEPHAQGKLVRVFKGIVYDVAVDLRRGSPTYAKWIGVELSHENKKSLWIPPGFAHGFYVLSEYAEFTYKCTYAYTPQAERGIVWNDPEIGIKWPVIEDTVLLSVKDQQNPLFRDADMNFRYSSE